MKKLIDKTVIIYIKPFRKVYAFSSVKPHTVVDILSMSTIQVGLPLPIACQLYM